MPDYSEYWRIPRARLGAMLLVVRLLQRQLVTVSGLSKRSGPPECEMHSHNRTTLATYCVDRLLRS